MKDKARVLIFYLPNEIVMRKSQVHRDMGVVKLKHSVYFSLVYDLRRGRRRCVYPSGLPTTVF